MLKPPPQPNSSQHRPQRPRRTAHTLREAMNRAQHTRVRRTVVHQYDRAGQSERPADDLQRQNDRQTRPDQVGLVREECEERQERVCDRTEREEDAVAFQGSEFGVDEWVAGDLEGEADDADDGGGHADVFGAEAESAGEGEGEVGVGVCGAGSWEEYKD